MSRHVNPRIYAQYRVLRNAVEIGTVEQTYYRTISQPGLCGYTPGRRMWTYRSDDTYPNGDTRLYFTETTLKQIRDHLGDGVTLRRVDLDAG